MAKKMLAILGSPHTNGTSAIMLEHAVKTAESCGWHVDKINLYDADIAFCIGCRKCLTTGECIRKDDAAEIAALLKACDVAVIACPSYWANVPAVVKNMFDRLLGTVMEETKTFPKPKLSHNQQYLLLTSCKTAAPFSYLFGQITGPLHSMKEFFHYSGMRPLGCVTCSGMDNTGISSAKKAVPDKKLRKIETLLNRCRNA